MSPEDRMHRDALPVGDVVVPFEEDRLDPELAAIDTELRRASDRMHRARARDGRERPSGSFTGSLRARLLAEAARPLPAAAEAGPAARAGGAPHDAPHDAPAAESYARTPGHVTPRVARRTPTILPAPRWSILAVAAVFVASVIGLNADRLFDAPAPSRVTAAAAASIERDGTVTPLLPGTELRAGDTVRAAAAGGAASLALGGSILRLEAGAAVRLDTLTATIAVEQLDGRVWHRVDVPDGGAYRVTTGDLAWTAVGTAFDLERSRTRVRLLTVEHDVVLTGPGVSLRIPEGRDALVDTAGDDPDVSVDGVDAAAPGDPWLVANARLDLAAGFGTGWLTTAALDPSAIPSPSTEPSAAPGSPEPSPGAPSATPATPSAPPLASPGPTPEATAKATPRPTATATATATPKATPVPTPAPTAKPTATPTPTPGLLALSLAPSSCSGAALLTWSGYPGNTFHHWTILRAPDPFEVPATYPPPAGITALGASYSKNPSVSSFADTSLAPGSTAYYRVVAWDASDRAIAASPAKALTGKPVASLGTFGAAAAPGGADASWSAYGGPGSCFTYYKITWSASNPNPSYVGGHDGALPVGDQGATSQYVALPVGTWWIRVEAILATDLGKHVVGKSSVAQVTVGP